MLVGEDGHAKGFLQCEQIMISVNQELHSCQSRRSFTAAESEDKFSLGGGRLAVQPAAFLEGGMEPR